MLRQVKEGDEWMERKSGEWRSKVLPMKIQPVEGLGLAEGVDGQLHQLVVAEVQRPQGGRHGPGGEGQGCCLGARTLNIICFLV